MAASNDESMGEESLLLIKKWIFEHACKYGMNSVMRAVYQKNGNKSLSQVNDASFVKPNPAFMFVTLVEVFQEKLRSENSWDTTFLIMITEMLDNLYKKNHFVPIKRFMNAITRLKLMELLKLMLDGKDSSEVVRRVNVHFPRWNKNTQDMIKEQYKIFGPTALKKTEKATVASRRFMLELLVSKEKWRNYQENSYSSDMKQFADAVNKELIEMMKVLRPQLPPSPIEQVLNGANEDLTNSDDAAIQILLEHLHVDMNEADFLNLLSLLEPESESQVNPMPFAPVLDGFSESASFTEDTIISCSDDDSDAPTEVICGSDEDNTESSLSEILYPETECYVVQESDHHSAMHLDDLPVENLSDSDLRPRSEIEERLPNPVTEETKKVPDKRKRGRLPKRLSNVIPPCKRHPSVISCSEGSSDDSDVDILPDLGVHLVRECVKPCVVKLCKELIVKEDGIKYEIFT